MKAAFGIASLRLERRQRQSRSMRNATLESMNPWAGNFESKWWDGIQPGHEEDDERLQQRGGRIRGNSLLKTPRRRPVLVNAGTAADPLVLQAHLRSSERISDATPPNAANFLCFSRIKAEEVTDVNSKPSSLYRILHRRRCARSRRSRLIENCPRADKVSSVTLARASPWSFLTVVDDFHELD